MSREEQAEQRRVNLGLLILNEGISSRQELRERAKAEGLYTSEGGFSRDLARLRKDYGDTKEFFFTGRGNFGGGRKSIVVNGVKYKMRKVAELGEDGFYARGKKGEKLRVEYVSEGRGPEDEQTSADRLIAWQEQQLQAQLDDYFGSMDDYLGDDEIYELY